MALPVVDDFNRADGGLGANWTTVTGFTAPAIVSQLVQETAGGTTGLAIYTGDTFPDNQYASITITAVVTSTTRSAGVTLRGVTTERTQYECQVAGPLGATATLTIYRINAGSVTSLITSGAIETVNSGDILKGSVLGSTVKLYINENERLSVVDGSPIASGKPGIELNAIGAGSDVQIDNFQAGEVGTTTGLRPAICL
jgi:hypothetical protein